MAGIRSKGRIRPLWIALACFACSVVMLYPAPPQVALQPQTAAPGGSVSVPVSFLARDNSVAAIQFDLVYDSSVMAVETSPGDAARNSGKDVYTRDMAPGRKRFLIVGMNQNPIVDGALLNLSLSVPPAAAFGTYSIGFSALSSADPDGGAVQCAAIDGKLTVASDGVPLKPAGVLNTATMLPGPIAPGELITLLGPGIGSGKKSELQVLLNGSPAPLLSVSPNRIDVVAPYGVSGSDSADIVIGYSGQTSAETTVPIAPASPGIFTLDRTGTGQAAAMNEDNSVNSATNPAARGTIVTLFATGGGNTDPPGTDGLVSNAGDTLPSNVLPVTASIGAVDAEVVYAGAAPGMIAGVLQVNCRVPLAVSPGSLPILIQAGSYASQPGVTIAVK